MHIKLTIPFVLCPTIVKIHKKQIRPHKSINKSHQIMKFKDVWCKIILEIHADKESSKNSDNSRMQECLNVCISSTGFEILWLGRVFSLP